MKNCLFVLDLDNTLICSENIPHLPSTESTKPSLTKGAFTISFVDENYKVHIRPGTKELIHFFEKHEIPYMVWSAGTKEYVREIVKNLGIDHVEVWSRDQCEEVVWANDNEDLSVEYAKNFWTLWEFDPNFGPENTIMIDDKDEIARYNKNNLIKIPFYDPKKNYFDDGLHRLVEFLESNINKLGNAIIICNEWSKEC